ncbi:MAG TPA: hypothetical protein VK446_10460 [Methylocystis sp.]|nr:hypothetical protein [Methylocystis sp.]
MIRSYRLTNEPGGLGLSCVAAGVSLAGVPLLRKTDAGFAPRPMREIAALIDAAYGADPTRLHSSLTVIAEALNRANLALASIAAVQSRVSELSPDAALRVARAEQRLAKFVPEQPRDWRGRWTEDGGGAPSGVNATDAKPSDDATNGAERTLRPARENGAIEDREANDEGARAKTDFQQTLQNQYDELGPTEFAKEVYQFGYQLESQGRSLAPADKERALAEYSFLQDRLSFWLGYDDKPPQSQAHLIGAAFRLYQGAINGGVAQVGKLPRSMLYVAGGVAFDSPPQGLRPSERFANELGSPAPRIRRRRRLGTLAIL